MLLSEPFTLLSHTGMETIRLTVVVGVVIGVIVGLVASGGRGVVSAVVVVALPKRLVGQCLMAGWDLDGIHTWLLVPELVTSYPFPLDPDD